MEEERAEQGRAKVSEGAEYTSTLCYAKDQARRGGDRGDGRTDTWGFYCKFLWAHMHYIPVHVALI